MRVGPGEVVGGGGVPTGQEAHPPAEQTVGLAYDVPAHTNASATGFLLDALRRRRAGRIGLSTLTVALFIGGMGMFTYPFLTDLYTEQVVQQRLSEEFAAIEVVDSSEEWAAPLHVGDPLTRMWIPALGVDTVVVSGTSSAALRAGAGHFPNTALPGQAGNVAIAGHRTTYGKPFNRIDELTVGDRIWLETPIGDFAYVVSESPSDLGCQPLAERDPEGATDTAACITDPKGWQMVGNTVGPVLTLMACHPKGSAAQRIWIRAELATSHPRGTWQARGAGGGETLG